jgi:hypothetical protein
VGLRGTRIKGVSRAYAAAAERLSIGADAQGVAAAPGVRLNPARCTPRWRPATAAPKTLLRPHLGAVHAMRGSALLRAIARLAGR